MAPDKQHAHQLLDQLDSGQLAAVVYLLEAMTDPVARNLANSPLDDEPVREEEARQIAAARAALDRGEGIPHEQVLAEFGISLEDFQRLGRTPLAPHDTNR